MLTTSKPTVTLCFFSPAYLFILQMLSTRPLRCTADTRPTPSRPQAWGHSGFFRRYAPSSRCQDEHGILSFLFLETIHNSLQQKWQVCNRRPSLPQRCTYGSCHLGFATLYLGEQRHGFKILLSTDPSILRLKPEMTLLCYPRPEASKCKSLFLDFEAFITSQRPV